MPGGVHAETAKKHISLPFNSGGYFPEPCPFCIRGVYNMACVIGWRHIVVTSSDYVNSDERQNWPGCWCGLFGHIPLNENRTEYIVTTSLQFRRRTIQLHERKIKLQFAIRICDLPRRCDRLLYKCFFYIIWRELGRYHIRYRIKQFRYGKRFTSTNYALSFIVKSIRLDIDFIEVSHEKVVTFRTVYTTVITIESLD